MCIPSFYALNQKSIPFSSAWQQNPATKLQNPAPIYIYFARTNIHKNIQESFSAIYNTASTFSQHHDYRE